MLNVFCSIHIKSLFWLPDHCVCFVICHSSTSSVIYSVPDITSCASVCIQNDARYCVAHRHCIRRA